MTLVRAKRLFVASLAALVLGSCSAVAPSRCADDDSITERALLDAAVGKIVRRSLASSEPDEIKYSSAGHFYRSNPGCCYLSRGELTKSHVLKLPITRETELTIVYRAFQRAKMPYRLRHVTIGHCPADQEEADTRLSSKDYSIKLNQKLGRRIL